MLSEGVVVAIERAIRGRLYNFELCGTHGGEADILFGL